MAAKQTVKQTVVKSTTKTKTTKGLGAVAPSPTKSGKPRKVRSDKGKKRGTYKKRKS